MKRFVLRREADPTGISGTGDVAEGVQFTDGTCVIRWRGPYATTTVHDQGMTSIEAIHGHVGSTRVVWLDSEETE